MINSVTIPTMIDWMFMDDLEKTAWGAAFATAFPLGIEVAARKADQCVVAIRGVAPERNPPQDPAVCAARIGVDIERDAFGIWYETERHLQHGYGRHWTPLTADQVDLAYSVYVRGRSDFD